MSDDQKSSPSFSPAIRWRIGLDVAVRTMLVVAVVGMLNFLGGRFFERFHWSTRTEAGLSPHSLSVVQSLTNHVAVTLYYDRQADAYPVITALLTEYRAANKNITVRTVDYVRDPGAAEMTKEKYVQFFASPSDTNLVIFDCGGRVQVLPGDKLTSYEDKLTGSRPRENNPQLRDLEFEKRPVAFRGEQAFTSILLALAHPQTIKAYYLKGHNEVPLEGTDNYGYATFASVLQQNYIGLQYLDFIGATGIPMDCNLLIIAGPSKQFEPAELEQIAKYLRDGGRLLVFFGNNSRGKDTGLEGVLKTWGVGVMDDTVQDFSYSTTAQGYDVIVDQFGKHPVVQSLSQMQLHLYLPRPILKLTPTQVANAPELDELFWSSPGATLLANRSEPPHTYPLAVAVEQRPVAGVSNPRGNTQIIVVGDYTFLGNLMIDHAANRDFLTSAVNWLCDRPLLVAGIGPRPVTDFRLHITKHQETQLGWLLLGVLPGGVLLAGWLVWLVRRK